MEQPVVGVLELTSLYARVLNATYVATTRRRSIVEELVAHLNNVAMACVAVTILSV